MESIKKNACMYMILKVSTVLFPIITFPYVSRILMAEGLGKVSFASSVVTYFTMLAQLGIPTYGITICARIRDDKKELSKTVHEILALNLVTMIVSYLLFFVFLNTVERLSENRTLMLVTSITILFNTFGIEWLYSALEKYTYITIRSLIFKILSLFAIFLFIHDSGDYIEYAVILMSASVGSNVYNLICLNKIITFKKYKKYNIKRHIKPILVFFAMSVSATVYSSLDSVMLGFIKTDVDVGYYNAATKIRGVLISFVTSIGTVLMPRSSYYLEHGKRKEFFAISRKAMDFILYISVPLTIYFILFAKESVVVLSGNSFMNAVPVMQIIMPTLVFIGVKNLMGMQILVPMGKEKYVLYSEIIGACLNFVLNMILIPFYSAVGAAFSTLLAEFSVFYAQILFMRNMTGIIFKNIKLYTFFVSGGIAAVFTAGLYLLDLGYIILLILSAVVYFSVYFLLMHMLKNSTGQMIESVILKKVFHK